MSRIGKKLITIPSGVTVKIDQGNLVSVKSAKGELVKQFSNDFEIIQENGVLKIYPKKENKNLSTLWGLFRALLANMIKGVSEGYEKKLEIEGIGYKAQLVGDKLVLNLGLSHPVEFITPKGINFKVEKNIITVSGIDKELVGQVAADIRAFKKPEPYKGKGIHYLGETIRRKAGKKAVATTG